MPSCITAPATLSLAILFVWSGADVSRNPELDPAQLPRFRSGIDIVTLDVTVLDRDRRPIRGLSAADFTLLEDGKPHEIVSFDEVIVPDAERPAASWVRDVAPDVKTNQIEPQGRILILVMDDANLPPALGFVEHAKRSARRIVEMMGPWDLAAVVFTLDNKYAQDFTSDRERLLAAIDHLTYHFALDKGRDPYIEHNYSVRTLKAAVEYLGAIPQRRKAVIYVSTGIYFSTFEPTQIAPPGGLGGGGAGERIIVGSGLGPQRVRDSRDRQVLRHLLETFALAQRSNVNVYPIDPGGLGGVESYINLHNLPLDPTYFREYLQIVAENTGGFAIMNDNEPAEQVGRILAETGAYYLLGYRTDPSQDGRLRRLQVRVNRPGATVRTRSHYIAEKAKKSRDADAPRSSPLVTALSGFLPKGDVPLHVTAAPFAIPGKKEAAVAIVVRVRQPAVAARTVQNVEVLTRAFDPQGRPKGSWSQNARVVLLPTDSSEAEYEVLSRVDLKPGRYQLRIAVHNPPLGKTGSVHYDVAVPDFSKEGLWLSAVVLSSRFGLAAAPRDVVSTLLPVLPTTVRDFSSDDDVTVFMRVYQPSLSAVHRPPAERRSRTDEQQPVRIVVQVLNSEGSVVAQIEGELQADRFTASGAADYHLRLPLERLSAGPHLLRIEARAGEHVLRRDVRFARSNAGHGSSVGAPWLP